MIETIDRNELRDRIVKVLSQWSKIKYCDQYFWEPANKILNDKILFPNTEPDWSLMDDSGRGWIHERCHSYGMNVVRDPALAHRYVVWIQPTHEDFPRMESSPKWDEDEAYEEACHWLYVYRGERGLNQ